MKTCPNCNRTFEDTFTFCLADGSLLNAPFDPQATLTIPEPRQTVPPPTEVLPRSESEELPPESVTTIEQPEAPNSAIAATIESPAIHHAPWIQTAESTLPPQLFGGIERPVRKSNRLLWAVGIAAVIIVSVTITLFAIKYNSYSSPTDLSPAEAEKRGIAAIVNGKSIMSSEVDRVVSQQAGDQQGKLTQAELTTARLKVLDNLIQREALYQRAQKEGMSPSEDEVTQHIGKMIMESGMTQEQADKRLQEQHLTQEDLREESRKNLAIQRLQDKAHGNIKISDKEVEDYYNKNKEQFSRQRGVQLSIIVTDPADNGAQDDAKSVDDAKSKIDAIYQQLKVGDDFAELARTRSEDRDSVDKGGDIGFLTETSLRGSGFPQDLIKRFFVMRVGDITQPVKANDGRLVIFKVMSHNHQVENLTLESPGVKSQIVESLTKQRKEVVDAALISQAMNEAKIVNFLASKI